ncbi:MAG: hydrogenase iron-sulfur subunit [bacterium]|nr:hydrogenase iron-sulfur subunit [bacterium]
MNDIPLSSSATSRAHPAIVTRPGTAAGLDRWGWRPADWLFNRVFGSKWSPLYQSGVLAVTFLVVTLVTGLYLFLFYKVGDPYGSVAAIDRGLVGGFMRSVHRYAADLAMVAVALHALKMLVAGKTWGPRATTWISGILLVGTLLICGWTGLIMAWDVQGQLVAIEGARIFDLLPIFSEPIGRSFARAEGVPESFFFMNLFLHLAVPLGLLALFWLHVTRVARPCLRPPRGIERYALGILVAGAILVPVPLPPEADLLSVPAEVPLDLFYAFWLPVARNVSPGVHLALWSIAVVGLFSVPWWWRPRGFEIAASHVDEGSCTGCTTCYQDCPYDAINMVDREVPSRASAKVARVDPALCVSCGICSGSCAPMGVGPPGRTGREQLRAANAFLEAAALRPSDVVLVACGNGLGTAPAVLDAAGGSIVPYETGCSGSVHTSVIELLLRRGAGGVFLLTCPGRDCLYREGPKWLHERVYNDREADLRDRVDKRRVRIASFSRTEAAAAASALAAFCDEVAALGEKPVEHEVKIDLECEVPVELVV